jgi:signal transduction histidine kinase
MQRHWLRHRRLGFLLIGSACGLAIGLIAGAAFLMVRVSGVLFDRTMQIQASEAASLADQLTSELRHVQPQHLGQFVRYDDNVTVRHDAVIAQQARLQLCDLGSSAPTQAARFQLCNFSKQEVLPLVAREGYYAFAARSLDEAGIVERLWAAFVVPLDSAVPSQSLDMLLNPRAGADKMQPYLIDLNGCRFTSSAAPFDIACTRTQDGNGRPYLLAIVSNNAGAIDPFVFATSNGMRVTASPFDTRITPQWDIGFYASNFSLVGAEGNVYVSAQQGSPANGEFSCSALATWQIVKRLTCLLLADAVAAHAARPDSHTLGSYSNLPDGLQFNFARAIASTQGNLMLQTKTTLPRLSARWKAYRDQILLAFVPMIGLAVLVAIFAYRISVRLVRVTSHVLGAPRSTTGNPIPHEYTVHRDELGDLASAFSHSFNTQTRQRQELLDKKRQLEDEVARSNALLRQLQQRNEELAKLPPLLGHDILSPLQAITAMVAPFPDGLHLTNKIKRAAMQLMKLFSEQNASPRPLPEVDLDKFLAEWIGNLRVRIPALVYRIVNAPKITTASVDPEDLESALDNIVNNARDFRAPDTEIAVVLSAHGMLLKIDIENIGPEIPEHMLSRIFDYGVSVRADDGSGHFGLGLFNSQRLVTRMNGAIQAQNMVGGVRFSVTFAQRSRPVHAPDEQQLVALD